MKIRALVYVALGLLPANLAVAQSFWGGAEIAFGSADMGNTDDGESGSLDGFALAGHGVFEIQGWQIMLDANNLDRGIPAGEDYDTYAPEDVSAYGLHVGRMLGDTYVGGFYGQNRFQGEDAGVIGGHVNGSLFGIEAEHNVGFGSVFGQIGKADMIGEVDDTGFDGTFLRLGVDARLGVFNMIASFERGTSPAIYEDTDDSGTYERYDISFEYPFNERVIGMVGVEMTDFVANTEDSSSETNLKLGVRVPIGGEGRRNNLKTTYMPGLAAAWAETLD